MDCQKTTSSLTRICIAVLLTLCALVGESSAVSWETFTSFRQVRRVEGINGQLYAVTSGGLMVIDDPSAPPERFTNTNGAGTVDLSDVIVDADGQVWLSGFGRIVRFDRTGSQDFLFFDSQGKLFRPLTLADDGDFLWVGTDIGLVLFSKVNDGGQIQDSYQLFGGLNPSPEVFDLLVSGDTIWLATSAGLAVADKSNVIELKDRTRWTTFDRANYPELGTDSILQVATFESRIYVGTARGLFELQRSAIDTGFVPVPVAGNSRINELRIDNDSLFVYSAAGVTVVKDRLATLLPLSGVTGTPMTGFNDGARRWVGTTESLFFSNNGSYSEYPFLGMPENDVADIAIDLSGRVWTLYRPGPLAVMQIDVGDTTWPSVQFPVGDKALSLITDSNGVMWAGTWGPGIWSLDNSQLRQYTDTVGSPASLDGAADNVVVTFGLFADRQYLFATSFLARNGNPVSVARLDNLNSPTGWTSFGIADGITDNWIVTLDYFDNWLVVGSGSGTGGVYRCYLGPDPFAKSDDFCLQYLEPFSQGNLISNTVRVVRFSPQGELWVGTNFGISRFDPGLGINGLFVDVDIPADVVFGPDITALDFDTRGNVWVGAANGLGRFDAATGEFTLYTSLNSGLVSDKVRSITVDHRTNDVWVGTAGGLSLVKTNSGKVTPNVNDVLAFPNPFVIRSHDDVLRFNFVDDAPVRIYSTAGELVAETTVNRSWDGRNQSGGECASGVYMFVITSADGSIGRGKFLLVRER